MENFRDRLIEQYAPIAANFEKELRNINIEGIPAPHIPIVGENYNKSQYRIAFIGMETYGWEDIDKFIDMVRENPAKAVVMMEETINQFEFLKWPANYHSTFWGFVLKFLSVFYKIEFDALVNKQFPEILSSFVWGNTNSIERFEITAQGNNVDYSIWEKVKRASLGFDTVNNLTKSVKPKLIFVLNRGVDREYIMTDDAVRTWGVDVEQRKSVMSIDVDKKMKIRYHFLRDENVHIFALPHPTWMGVYSSFSIDKYVGKVIEMISEYQIWKQLPVNPEDCFGETNEISRSSIQFKRKFVADLAEVLMNNNTVMSGKELQSIFNMNDISTQCGNKYSENGGRGVHHLISHIWRYYYHELKDYQTAYNISRAFVNQNGEYAWY